MNDANFMIQVYGLGRWALNPKTLNPKPLGSRVTGTQVAVLACKSRALGRPPSPALTAGLGFRVSWGFTGFHRVS